MFVKATPKKKARSRVTVAEPERRIPAQDRSRRRLERVLESAAVVFAEQGYEAATMEAIAERAETSIGSIYQFFTNKAAVYDELTRRYHARIKLLFDTLLAGPMIERPWTEVIDAGVDTLAAFTASDPGFRAVWRGLHLSPTVVAEGEAINRAFARRVEEVLTAKLPNLPPRQRSLVATMVVEIVTAMLIRTARAADEDGLALMTETKTVLRRYLAPFAETNAAPGSR